MTLISRKGLILAKKETTYGSDASPAAANALRFLNLDVSPFEADQVESETYKPYLGAPKPLQSNLRSRISFSVELVPSGTAGTAPGYGALLQACAMSETITQPRAASGTSGSAVAGSVVYRPVSDADTMSSVSIYYNNDGILHKMVGAMGSVALEWAAGQIPLLNFSFLSPYTAPTDTPAVTPVYSNAVDPLLFTRENSSSISIFGTTGLKLSSFSLDAGIETVFSDLPGASAADVRITDRRATGEVVFDAVSLATKDFFAAVKNLEAGSIDWTLGTEAGKRVVFSTSAATVPGAPTYGDRDGIQTLTLPFSAVPSDSGNDDFTLTYN